MVFILSSRRQQVTCEWQTSAGRSEARPQTKSSALQDVVVVDANDEDEKKERNEHGLHGLLNQLKESQKAHALFAADAQTKEQVKPKLKPVEPSSASDSEIEVFGGDLFKESKFKGLKANQHEEVDLEDVLEKQMDYVVLGNISYWFQFMFFFQLYLVVQFH